VRKYAPPTRSKSGQRIDASAKKPDLNPPSVNDDGYMTGAVIDESALGIDPQMQETLQKENMILQRRFETMVDQIRFARLHLCRQLILTIPPMAAITTVLEW
jgi:hypothetical protein